jgi:type I restriction enzyme S subunit
MDMRLRLYFDQLGQILVPFPPVEEQVAIIAFYVEATADLTSTISRLDREIALLRAYRTRLVADVVTGKLDVREVAARLPDQDPLRDFASSREPNPDDGLVEEADEEAVE